MREATNIVGFFEIPNLEKTVEHPFHALNAGFLSLQGILAREGLQRDFWPVVTFVKIKKAKVSQEYRDL